MPTIPHNSPLIRLAALGCGLAILVWLGMEDHSLGPVLTLGSLSALLIVRLWLGNRCGGQSLSQRGLLAVWILGGAAWGMLAALMTAGLMFFKTAQHSHIYPDYPTAMIAAMLVRAPAWALAGGLLGLAIALVWSVFQTEKST